MQSRGYYTSASQQYSQPIDREAIEMKDSFKDQGAVCNNSGFLCGYQSSRTCDKQVRKEQEVVIVDKKNYIPDRST